MRAHSGAISHVVLYVYDFPMMKDFYTNVLGFHLSDIGQGRGNDMKAMKVGDKAFFYHSVDERSIVGVVEVAREHYPDPTDPKGRFGMVDVTAKIPVKSPVTLSDIKAEPALANLALVKNSRLSVGPVGPAEWKLLCKMAGIKP